MPVWIIVGVCAAVVVLIATAATALGFLRGALPEPVSSVPVQVLPQSATASDIDSLHFSLAFRGYRMDEVDAVLDGLRDQLAEQQRQLAELTGAAPADDSEHSGDAPGDPAGDRTD